MGGGGDQPGRVVSAAASGAGVRWLETIAREPSVARTVWAVLAQSYVPSEEILRVRQDVAYQRARLRFRALEAELRAAIEAEEPPE